jgi:hypothetical protein
MTTHDNPRAGLISDIEMVALRLSKTTYAAEQAAQLLHDLFPDATIEEIGAALRTAADGHSPTASTPNIVPRNIKIRDVLRALRKRGE